MLQGLLFTSKHIIGILEIECHFFRSLALGLRQKGIGEHPKQSQQHRKQYERPLLGDIVEQGRKQLSNEDIGGPVDQHGQTDGGRFGSLHKQLAHNHPRYRTGSDRKKHNVKHHGHNAQVLDPIVAVLEHERHGHQYAEYEHAAQAEQVQKSASLILHERHRDEGHHHHDEANEWRRVFGLFEAGLFQNVLGVVKHRIDAAQLLTEMEDH